ncbi:MAG: peptidyl-prolyl cis-trans isomerase [Roseibium sp.]|nr:peptidyl-prolyl cis-trans isomerase [Roseibium sp.]
MTALSRFLRQPLLHFLVLGALIFVYYGAVAPSDPEPGGDPSSEIAVTSLQLDRLNTEFEAIWQRAPTTDEQQKLIDNFIREEVLVREALRLGLDRDDTVLRRRLVQKMDYLAASSARAQKPSEDDLTAHFEANRESYLRPGRVAFEQVFLGESPDETLTTEILTKLEAGVPFSELGKRTLLPSELGMSARAKVDGLFGDGLFETLQSLEAGNWQGPVKSGYGFHLVRITENQLPEQLTFEEARKFVTEDWSLQRYEQAKVDQQEALKSQYRIIVEGQAQ